MLPVTPLFDAFLTKLTIGSDLRSSIGARVGRMVRCLNEDFRDSASTSANSFYVGSYGRNTAIPSVSDIDALFVLPYATYKQYDGYSGNKQSALLQAMRNSIRRTYPSSEVAADGQVVVVSFTDGIQVEVLGAFLNEGGSYTFPDSNSGGSWRTCKPKDELDAFSNRNVVCNENLVPLGRMVRAWRDYNKVSMSGMLIDTLAYQFIEGWTYKDKSKTYYDWLTRDFFLHLSQIDPDKTYWLAPGSGSYVHKTGNFRTAAKHAYEHALLAVKHVEKDELWAAKYEFRQIYGTDFPS